MSNSNCKSERDLYYGRVEAGLGDAIDMLASVRNMVRGMIGLTPTYPVSDSRKDPPVTLTNTPVFAPCTPAPTTNQLVKDLNPQYNAPHSLALGGTTQGQIFVGKFRYRTSSTQPRVGQLSVEGNGAYADGVNAAKTVVISRCPGSFEKRDYANPDNKNCMQGSTDVGLDFDDATGTPSSKYAYSCHLTP
jgi:hypothetical protein